MAIDVTREDAAIHAFRSGYNCAQAVLGAFEDETGLDPVAARAVAAGFGGGMGRLQLTCGAVTGAVMVLGFLGRARLSTEEGRKEWTFGAVQDLAERFRSAHGSTDCASLLGCDLKSGRGRRRIEEERLLERVCEPCIVDAIRIVEELLRGGTGSRPS